MQFVRRWSCTTRFSWGFTFGDVCTSQEYLRRIDIRLHQLGKLVHERFRLICRLGVATHADVHVGKAR